MQKEEKKEPVCGETNLTNSSQKFTEETFKKIKKFRNPAKKTRNIILAFLTFFHDHLDYLVEDPPDEPDLK